MNNLFPPNSPPLVRAVEAAAAARLTEIPTPLRQIWDPWTCDLELLPWLAWSFSVDEWDDAWPEQTKRLVVAESIPVHFHKGTRGAVEDALAALGITIEVCEWFDALPEADRGTMQLTASIGENLAKGGPSLSPKFYAQVRRAVEAVKRGSIHYTFQIKAAFADVLGVVVWLSSLQRKNVSVRFGLDVSFAGDLGVGSRLFSRQTKSVHAALVHNATLASDLGVGIRFSSRQQGVIPCVVHNKLHGQSTAFLFATASSAAVGRFTMEVS